MIHGTKRDIFEDLLRHSLGVTRVLLGQNGNQKLFDKQVAADYADWKARYDVAPSETAMAPKAVIRFIKECKDNHYQIRNVLSVDDLSDDVSFEVDDWIYCHSDDFARAWIAYPNVEVHG